MNNFRFLNYRLSISFSLFAIAGHITGGLLLMFLPLHLNAQCGNLPPCAPANARCVPFGNNTITALTSGATPVLLPMPAAASTPQNVIVFGPITFDADYTFAPGSNIVVAANVALEVSALRHLQILTGSTVKGCTTMWTGILVRKGGRITLKGVTVEDAVRGVNMFLNESQAANSSLAINDCIFNLCYIGVSMGEESFAESIQRTVHVTTGGFARNKFNGGGTLKTNTIGTTGCHRGVHVNSVRPITYIANEFSGYGTSSSQSDPTLPSSLRRPMGMVVINHSPLIANHKYTNIGNVTAPSTAAPESTSSGLRIMNSAPQSVRVLGGTTTTVACGIFSDRYGSVSVSGHTFTTVIGGVFCRQSPLSTTGLVSLGVSSCTFNGYRDAAVLFSLNHTNIAAVNVNSNTFNDNNVSCTGSFFPGRTAITIVSPGNPIDMVNIRIRLNTITSLPKSFCSGYSSFGVNLENVNDGLIETNTFNDQQTTSVFNFNHFVGLRLINANRFNIWSNDFLGTAGAFSTSGKTSIGTEVQESGNLILNCNDYNLLKTGMSFKGEFCDNEALVFNNFATHQTGLLLNEDAVVGKQSKGENRWMGSSGQLEGNYLFPNYNPNNQSDVARVKMSEFLINDAVTVSTLWANPRAVGADNDALQNWFKFDPSLEGPGAVVCQSSTSGPYPPNDPKDPKETLSDANIRTLSNLFPPIKGYDASNMDSRFRAYDKLFRKPNLLNNGTQQAVTANAFYTANNSTALNTLHSAFITSSTYGQAEGSVLTDLQLHYSRFEGIYDQIQVIDEQMADPNIDPVKEADLINQRETLYNSYDLALSALSQVTSSLLSTEQQAASYQLNSLNSLTPASNWESTMSAVLKIVLNTKVSGQEPNANDISLLASIANSCRYSYGYGVVLARSIYKSYDIDPAGADARYLGADSQCDNKTDRNQDEVKVGTITATVSPNPVNYQLRIRVSGTELDARYNLVDIAGRTVKEGTITSNETWLNTTDLANGIYILNFSGLNTTAQNIKVVVAH